RTLAGRMPMTALPVRTRLQAAMPVPGIPLQFLLGLRFLRRFRLARTVEGDRLANERLEGGLVNFFSLTDRILQRRALGEGKLHDILVGSPVQMMPSCDQIGVP